MWEETKNKISQKNLTRLVIALPIVLVLVARAENNAIPHIATSRLILHVVSYRKENKPSLRVLVVHFISEISLVLEGPTSKTALAVLEVVVDVGIDKNIWLALQALGNTRVK
jgi:hypothetical protein